MLKKISWILSLLLFVSGAFAADHVILSPNKDVRVVVSVTDQITWSVKFKGKEVLSPSSMSMTLADQAKLGQNPKVTGFSETIADRKLFPAVPVKNRVISDHYRQLNIEFMGGYSLQFRLYDDAAAYRFKTSIPGQITVKNEQIQFNLAGDQNIWFPKEESFFSHQERSYEFRKIGDIAKEEFSSIPALVELDKKRKVLITESDLVDYPGFWLFGTGSDSLNATLPRYPLTTKKDTDRDIRTDKLADYIAVTNGTRTFPWRVLILSDDDAELLNNETVFKLAAECQIKDTSWIKPGKVSWDWWNAWNVFGDDVDFEVGINTATYKYYIDFAAKYGLEYVILDEGWSPTEDLLKVSDGLDMDELTAYAKEKNVGLILWVVWNPLDEQLEPALKKFKAWGIKGIKVDFMQRDDQWMVNYYYRIAKAAADYQMLVDFHGAYKPAGLRRAYPNVITREGVRGLENNKWSKVITPAHDVTLPFIRMVVGPMDFTPGAMDNAQPDKFEEIFKNPMSMGTRCHQLAMFVIYESPLQMLADTPSKYYRQDECTKFIAKVPTVWDKTFALEGKVGQYVMMARKSGDEYFIGAMTDSSTRQLKLDLSFLAKGKWTMEIFQDGPDAHTDATDYRKVIKNVKSSDKIKIKLAPGGGWAARVYPAK